MLLRNIVAKKDNSNQIYYAKFLHLIFKHVVFDDDFQVLVC